VSRKFNAKKAIIPQALAYINYIIVRINQEWAASDGNKILLMMLDEILSRNKARPDSPHYQVDYSGIVKSTLRLLLSISELGPSHKKTLGQLNVFGILLSKQYSYYSSPFLSSNNV
jgi:hypothetical protein